ncbi:MAG: M28 family metallopeptidase [Gammaproteobacteria bacterium]|nr:M28 family metallopeptidase [Gammaproteobacteria bacterium]
MQFHQETRLLCAAAIAAALGLTGCEQASEPAPKETITAAELMQHIEVLSADEFGGRAPASEGEEKTISYLKEQFAAAGAEPGNGDSYFQEVPLVEMTVTDSTPLEIAVPEGEPLSFSMPDQAVTWTKRVTDSVALENSEMVFVGYGVVAPEYGWNDYEGLDVEGKTVVMLVNDPGYALGETADKSQLFNGKAMTYYGRWTYKFEEAARQGAAGAIVIHETGPAGYPWEVVSGSWTGPQFDLVAEDRNMGRAAIEGWISTDAANALFEAAGQDFEALKAAALTADFEPVPLGTSASISLENSIRESVSRNVIAAIPGTTRPEETIIYTAHWDHIGTDPSLEDGIYNGAVDNASGTGALVELAEAHAAAGPMDRTVVFLAVTAEESGLLGSRWYAENPVYPLDKTVAAINMDSMNVYGPTSDVVVVGYGNSELEEYLATAAKAQGREILPEEHPERGYYYRSDHFNFAKQGVPALYAESGSDYIGENAEAAAEHAEAYTAERYHKPSDEIQPWFNLEGAVDDLRLYFEVAQMLGNSDAWPNWYEGNEFRAIRDASREDAAGQ